MKLSVGVEYVRVTISSLLGVCDEVFEDCHDGVDRKYNGWDSFGTCDDVLIYKYIYI